MTGKTIYNLRANGIRWSTITAHSSMALDEVLRMARDYASRYGKAWPPASTLPRVGPPRITPQLRKQLVTMVGFISEHSARFKL